MIRNIVFDFGNVLVTSRFRDHAKEYNIPDEYLELMMYKFYTLNEKDNREDLNKYELTCLYKDNLPYELKKYATNFIELLLGTYEIYDHTVPLIKELKNKGYKVYYLSNWNKVGFNLNKKNGVFDFIDMMDGGIVSYKVGCSKPDRRIYNMLTNKYNLDPKECLFVDDKPENVIAATVDCGWADSITFLPEKQSECLEKLHNLPNLNKEDIKEMNVYRDYGIYINEAKKNEFNKENFDLEKAKREGGYYWYHLKTGKPIWNSLVVYNGKICRERVETVVFNKNREIIGYVNKEGQFVLPGGSTEIDCTHIQQAENEINEELKIKVKNIQYTGYAYYMDNPNHEWEDYLPVMYDGRVTEIYIAEYDGKYTGHIAEEDKESGALKKSKWHKIDEIYNYLNDAQKSALNKFMITEAKLSTKDRNNLSDSQFGIPEDKKFPLNDKTHVEQAIKMFSRAEESKKKSLAKRIKSAASKYGINISPDSQVAKYLDESVIEESDINYKIIGFNNVDKIKKYGGSKYLKQSSNGAIAIDTKTNKIIGHVLVMHHGGGFGDLDVDSKYRRQGIATALLEYIMNEYNADHMWCYADNIPALNLYKKYGFEPILDGKTDDGRKYYYLSLHGKQVEIDESNIRKEAKSLAKPIQEASAKGIVKSKYVDKGDHVYNFDKWLNDKNNNMLYVTGVSGGGKSTIAEDIAKNYNAEYVEMDYVVLYFMKKDIDNGKQQRRFDKLNHDSHDAAQFLNSKNGEKYKSLINWKSHKELTRVYSDFIDWMNFMYKGNGKRYVLCGVGIYNCMPPTYFIDKPLLIKEPNMVRTVLRRTGREANPKDFNNFKDWFHQFKRNILLMKQMDYSDQFKYVSAYDKMISNYQESVLLKKEIEETAREFHLKNDTTTEEVPMDYPLPSITPYFTPAEMENLGVFSANPEDNYYGVASSSDDALNWFTTYKNTGYPGENYTTIIEDLMRQRISNPSDEIKQKILEYGWNPEIKISEKCKPRIKQIKESLIQEYGVKIVDLTDDEAGIYINAYKVMEYLSDTIKKNGYKNGDMKDQYISIYNDQIYGDSLKINDDGLMDIGKYSINPAEVNNKDYLLSVLKQSIDQVNMYLHSINMQCHIVPIYDIEYAPLSDTIKLVNRKYEEV